MEEKRKSVKGLLDGLWDFLHLLKEMEEKGLTEKFRKGQFDGPFGSNLRYEYKTRVGLNLRPGSKTRFAVKEKVPFYKATERRRLLTKVIKPEEMKEKEGLVEIMEKDDSIEVLAELPTVEEKNIELKMGKTVLKITVNRPEGKIEKIISIPDGSEAEKIEKASFKNGILEITLKKKKKEVNE